MSVEIRDAAGKRHRGLSLELTMPLRGAWVAHVETGDDVAVEGPVVIELARDNGAGLDTFTGTVRHGGVWAGRSEVVVVGGAGGLLTQLEPRHYAPRGADVPADLIAQDIARDAGEELDPEAASALADLRVGQWTRARLPGGVALGLLADELGLAWRVLDTGKIWIGEETWPEAAASDIGRRIDRRSDARAMQVAPSQATLRPGVTVFGERVHRVTYSGGRADLAFGDTDRDEAAAAIRGLVPPTVYGLSGGARVVQQHDDDTLDLELDDPRLPAVRRVPFRPGFPGARVILDAGARVRVSFENGSPSGAYAHAPDQRPASDKGIAREGDTVSCGFWRVTPAGDLVSAGPEAPGAVEITGAIVRGSSKVFLR